MAFSWNPFGRRDRPARAEAAARRLSGHAERLRRSADRIGPPYAAAFWDMAGTLERVRREVLSDPRDLALTRQFTSYHAGRIVEMVEGFVTLAAKSRPEQQPRVDALGRAMLDYRALFARIECACIDNDFDDLEAAIAALDVQLARLPG
ncbi:hypothetical protein [Rhodovulum euryhalinum]|uniref:5-bromo-4-chloroindolyl phosphate hydrolysis protein n=1 Tax=Rhodovulum euryhalinum TaxID=35805 RepID=A0A4R2KCY8_9RHOB|nr:hypothetical protein [Rhodovulum euryhalinum]TCO70152.1 hypothetical protein EV655_11194 [Rhodovulum euryhalinum]